MNFKKLNKKDIIQFDFSQDINQEVYLLYRKLFTEYIIEKTDLKRYDDEIKNSNLNFIPVEEKNMDIYQYFSSDILKYFYIRNNLYLEKLDKKEIDLLEKKIQNQNFDLDESSRDMIAKTYKKVLFKDRIEGFKNFVFYGPSTMPFSSEDDAVVIGFRYDEFNLNGMNDDEWNNIFEKQQLWLFQFIEKLKYEFAKKIENATTIIKYNEYSITSRN